MEFLRAYVSVFSALILLAGQQNGMMPVKKNLVLVCRQWRFNWSLAHLLSSDCHH